MPFALVPEDYKVQKVSKAQERAINAKRRHDNVVELLRNPNTPIIFGTPIVAFITGLIAKQAAEGALQSIQEKTGDLADDVKEAARQGAADAATGVDIVQQLVRTGKVNTGLPGAPSITLDKLIEEGLKRFGL